jgi:uncharacterized membrane protein
MKSKLGLIIILTLIILLGSLAFVIWGIPYFFGVDVPSPSGEGFGSETVKARVDRLLEEGVVDVGGVSQPYQRYLAEVLEGEYAGTIVEIEYGRQEIRTDDYKLRTGDEVWITLYVLPDDQLVAYFVDYARSRSMALLAGLFVVAILVISRWKGLRSLLAMAFSLLVIVGYIIPHILSGEDPVRVSLIGAGLLLSVTLYLTYGWNLKTHSAVLSMLIVLVITGTLAWLFVSLARITGSGDESTMFVLQIPGVRINVSGLFLGGMIIGALGVLDDLVTTQASAVFELHAANPKLGLRNLSRAAMRIGQDHVAATVNTLVLAYAGASLPMLLLFAAARSNYAYLIDSAIVAEEIVRTLVGSLGLVMAVPIATFIAALLALYSERLGPIRPYLGPESGHERHSHSHG